MRVFEKPNLSGDWKCPICKTRAAIPVVLIGIAGTEEGNNMRAEQFHLECLELASVTLPDGRGMIMQVYDIV